MKQKGRAKTNSLPCFQISDQYEIREKFNLLYNRLKKVEILPESLIQSTLDKIGYLSVSWKCEAK